MERNKFWVRTRYMRCSTPRAPLLPRKFHTSIRQRSPLVATQNARPFRMAVIGSGPAGFYTTKKVMSNIENSVIDMYEQLPVPFGLVRFGVAPDHPDVKNCQHLFEEVAESPRFNFVGNISIGKQEGALPLETLLPHYDAILFAYGASRDRALNIPGEDALKGVYSARAFVGWYNGLPEYADLEPDLTLGEEAIVIGNGNVAMDVVRILLQDIDILRKTDITNHAIETLKKSKVKRVRVVGRRGPIQAAFELPELRELLRLPLVAFHPVEESMMPDLSLIPKDIEHRRRRRKIEALKKGGVASVSTGPKSWSLDFCKAPVSINKNPEHPGRLGSMLFEKTAFSTDLLDPEAKAIGTGEVVEIPAALVFRSIGYKSEALSEFKKLQLPFDDKRGIVPNEDGRLVDPKNGQVFPGIYCAGWVKSGPTGNIDSTMRNAFNTAESITVDWQKPPDLFNFGKTFSKSTSLGWEGVKDEAESRGCRRVCWADWKTIDSREKERGETVGKEREKFTSIEEMLAVLD